MPRLTSLYVNAIPQITKPAAEVPQNTASHIHRSVTSTQINIYKLLSGDDKNIWSQSLTHELDRIFQGIDNTKGAHTTFFIKKVRYCTEKRSRTRALYVK